MFDRFFGPIFDAPGSGIIGAIELPTFSVDFTQSPLPLAGDATPTITRNSGAATTDFDGTVKECEIGEARVYGARRVRNLRDSTLTTQVITVISGHQYQVSISGDSGATCVASGAFTGTITANGTNRKSYPNGTPKTATTTSLTLTITGALDSLVVEDVTGQANQNPSENVVVGLPSPYYGFGIDGVRYFAHENGNTVDASGNISESYGGAINTPGYTAETQITNRVKYNEEIGNISAWTTRGTAAVVANDAVAPNGETTAEKLTVATFGNDVFQIASGYTGSSTIVPGVYIKKISSTGTLNIGQPVDYTTYGHWQVDLSQLGSGWEFITKYHPAVTEVVAWTADSGGSGGFLFFGSSEISFYAWRPCVKEQAYNDSTIKTVSTAVTRIGDKLDYQNYLRNYLPNDFTIIVECTPLANGSDYSTADMRIFGSADSRGGDYEIRTSKFNSWSFTVKPGGGVFLLKNSDFVSGTPIKLAFSLTQDDATNSRVVIWKDGSEVLNTTQAHTVDHSDQAINIGYWDGFWSGFYIKNFKIYKGLLSDGLLECLTT